MEKPKYDPANTIVSYTQFSMYSQCPKSWELAYARNLRSREPNIYFIFGTAMHVTIQAWMDHIFNERVGEFNPNEFYGQKYLEEYQKQVEKWGENFSNREELSEFYDDGINIIEFMKKRRVSLYFNPRKYEFIGSEIPIATSPDQFRPKIKFFAYLDLVFKEKATGTYNIVDIKTSTRGWNNYMTGDMTKMAQLLLYKYYFSKVYDIDISKIKTEYFIVKRKIQKDSDWKNANEHVQEHFPIQTEMMCNKYAMIFKKFLDDSFDSTGEPILDREYPAIAGKDYRNCKFCEFADDEELCPKSERFVKK